MKKLIIAAAIVCAAAASQAASAAWSTGDVYYKGVGSELKDGSGVYDFTGKAYLFLLTAEQYDSITIGNAKSIWDKFDASNNTLDFGTSLGQGTFKKAVALDDGVGFFGNIGDFTTNPYAAIIVTHEDGAGKIDAYSANTMYAVASPTALTGAGAAALGWGEKAMGTATTWQANAIPEPTSGLLLLLGMAGLALRRRRA